MIFHSPLPHAHQPSRRRSAFTLIEVLVVMGIIVLLIALALPAFSFITGSRSAEAASNQIAGALSVARAKAIGLQKICGIMFFIEPTSDNVQIMLVEETDRPSTAGSDTDAPANAVNVYLDRVDQSEFVKLPAGVGIQTVTNAIPTATAQPYPPGAPERYVGFNGVASDYTTGTPNTGWTSDDTARPATQTKVGGVILFDANGILTAKTYALRTRRATNTAGTTFVATPMGETLDFGNNTTATGNADYIPTDARYVTIGGTDYPRAPVSQLGFVLFDQALFVSREFKLGDDTRVNGQTYSDTSMEGKKELWLDENGTPTMINRYNGTLVRGE